MNKPVIADTGPLVALFDRGDEHHEWARRGLAKIRAPLATSEAVLGEVLFLLRNMPRSRAALLGFWAEGGLVISLDAEREKSALVSMLRKYADVGMSPADATVLRLSELQADGVVWTLDSHFRIYRRLGRRVVPLLDWPRR